ncbi:MAG TPA: HD domain-containing phosphohydrolase, partial [Kofleriaceae bacterium]|nr:HD domain-containing phosphohydrolase [Kofleriaceae bacterium]
AHEQAKWFGDDIAVKAIKYQHGIGMRGTLESMRFVGAGSPLLHRFRIGLELMVSGHRELEGMIEGHARIARMLADELGLPSTVGESLGSAYEQWGGRGWPGVLSHEQIPIAARIAQIAEFIEVAHRVGGPVAALATARKYSGSQFDPSLATLVRTSAQELFDGLDGLRTWDAVIDAEPALAVVLSDPQFDAALLAIATFVDLKSPHTLGHSRAVAELAAAAGVVLDLPASDVHTLRRAGLVHGFGRLGISASIWDKPGPLGAGEWERVRMQPYITERMLHQSAVLAPVAAVAVQHRERLDGSGYPRAIAGSAISVPARILGAADAYQAMREPRPYRAARSADEAAAALRLEARCGRMDGPVVEAILGVAGHRVRRKPEGVAGLTAREIEVLRLLVRGLSTKQIAVALAITPKTAANHIEHIYAKIDATNRATASLFAMQHGLFPEEVVA